jgi:hypothetical protein
MTNIYKILFNGRPIGLCYIGSHLQLEGQKIASIVPLTRKGKFEDSTLEIHFENPVHDIFPDSIPDIEIAKDLCGQAKIEGWKVEIVSTSLAGPF